MSDWSPGDYLRFDDERTRPSLDLVARVAVEDPGTVVDLGCGPGNSTQVLAQRWPAASLTGLDSSAGMIDAARAAYPQQHWIHATIESWAPATQVDVVFSNAALQWVPDHGSLIERLFATVTPGGTFAFQIPSADFARVRTLIHEVARSGDWAPRMNAPLQALTMESPGFYYDHLAPRAKCVDMWETEYVHVLASPDAVIDWISSTGLRPFLDVLKTQSESERFVARLAERVRECYPRRADGKVLFPFKRTFVIAYA